MMDLVHEKYTDGDSHVTTPLALLFCLPKIIIHVCQVWMHSGVRKHSSLGSLDLTATGDTTKEKCLRFEKAVWTAAAASSETTNPFHSFGAFGLGGSC